MWKGWSENNADGIQGDCMKNSKHFVAYIVNRWAAFQEKRIYDSRGQTFRKSLPGMIIELHK